LAQVLYSLVSLKQKYRMADNHFADFLVFIVTQLFRPEGYDGERGPPDPDEVTIPASKYMMYRLLGVK
jgi:hypothetical protein